MRCVGVSLQRPSSPLVLPPPLIRPAWKADMMPGAHWAHEGANHGPRTAEQEA